jgi:hypothetical protein
MYALVKDGILVAYPYGIDTLKRDNPNVSFPKRPDPATLQSFGVVSVYASPAPEITNRQRLQEESPICEEGVWKQQWSVVSLTDEELSNQMDSLAQTVRVDRNYKLSQCDWTQAKDVPAEISDSWAVYRQQLRDITEQENFPWEVVWPEPPTN